MPASSVPIPYIDAAGFHMPAWADVLAAHKVDYQGVYGADVDLTDAADQDVEWLTIEAFAMMETFALGLAIYEAFSPVSAQGTGLSSVVKVNGITRKVASNSTCTVTVIGQAGTILTDQQVSDGANAWTLPSSIVIPFSGTINVTATCMTPGAVAVQPGQLSTIINGTRGLQSISNAAPASVGLPIERDSQLRVRQALSVAKPSQTVLDGIVADILSIPGVTRAKAYENDTDVVDANGIPPHGTAFVVDGGDAQVIAQAIALKKTQGSPTYGTATQAVLVGKAQIPRQIQFFRPVEPPITYNVTVATLPGYTLDTRAAIKQALADFTNAQGIGGSNGIIAINDAYGPVLGVSIGGARPFKVKSITVGRSSNPTQAADIPVAFYEAPLGLAANVNVAEVAS